MHFLFSCFLYPCLPDFCFTPSCCWGGREVSFQNPRMPGIDFMDVWQCTALLPEPNSPSVLWRHCSFVCQSQLLSVRSLLPDPCFFVSELFCLSESIRIFSPSLMFQRFIMMCPVSSGRKLPRCHVASKFTSQQRLHQRTIPAVMDEKGLQTNLNVQSTRFIKSV